MSLILIVDDDPSLLLVLCEMLEMCGHVVVGKAKNGIEAVNLFKALEPRPEFIVMDHRMPVMNGLEASEIILRLDQGVRIIVSSADLEVRDKFMDIGCAGFVVKPFSIDTLLECIKATAQV